MCNMFISKLERPEPRRNHSLTSRCRFINLKVHKSRYVLQLKPVPVAFQFPLFFAYFLKKYGNEIEIDQKL